MLSVGLKDDNCDDLVDLNIDPWNSLPALTVRPQREDLAEEIIHHCYVSENLWLGWEICLELHKIS